MLLEGPERRLQRLHRPMLPFVAVRGVALRALVGLMSQRGARWLSGRGARGSSSTSQVGALELDVDGIVNLNRWLLLEL